MNFVGMTVELFNCMFNLNQGLIEFLRDRNRGRRLFLQSALLHISQSLQENFSFFLSLLEFLEPVGRIDK